MAPEGQCSSDSSIPTHAHLHPRHQEEMGAGKRCQSSTQASPSERALRAAAAEAQRKGVCLPGNPSPCNRVSRDTARDALTSAPKARAKPARWHRAGQSRPARGRLWAPSAG